MMLWSCGNQPQPDFIGYYRNGKLYGRPATALAAFGYGSREVKVVLCLSAPATILVVGKA